MIKVVDQPEWIDHEDGLKIQKAIYAKPTWWLDNGIEFKYVQIRFDARTGSMLFMSDPTFGGEPKYLIWEE